LLHSNSAVRHGESRLDAEKFRAMLYLGVWVGVQLYSVFSPFVSHGRTLVLFLVT